MENIKTWSFSKELFIFYSVSYFEGIKSEQLAETFLLTSEWYLRFCGSFSTVKFITFFFSSKLPLESTLETLSTWLQFCPQNLSFLFFCLYNPFIKRGREIVTILLAFTKPWKIECMMCHFMSCRKCDTCCRFESVLSLSTLFIVKSIIST